MPSARTTTAVVFEAALRVVVRDVEIPEPGPDDVVVDTVTSWISPGTELSYLRGDRVYGDTAAGPDQPYPFPRVAGYQKIGTVVETGSNVASVREGQTVFQLFGRVNDMLEPYAGHVHRSVSPASEVYTLPEGADPEWFSGGVLTQVGYNCGCRAPVRPGGLAVVLGDGLVGLWTAQTLQHRGARVWLVGHHADRLQRFVCREGDRTINAHGNETVDVLRAELAEPVSVLVETIGALQVMIDLVPNMRHDGHLVCAAFYGQDDAIRIPSIRCQELSLHTPASLTRPRMEQTFDWIARGVLDTASMITHRLPVTEAPRAYDMLLNRTDGALGVLLQW